MNKPTMEILEKICNNSRKSKDEVFTRLFRYLLRPDIYFKAYQNLYANSGAATKGIDDDTADGFSEEKIAKIIQSLKDNTYQPTPVRRVYIEKANGKLRPLGIPSFTDKLVQEAIRMLLEAIYEPIFLDNSHGFRPNRSCHTALASLKKEFTGAKWFVEGDIKGCFDNIDHIKLIGFINNKVKDANLSQLIYKFLKAGYVENWKYHKTFIGTPQGGIISPILANIYLHELDKFVMKLGKGFEKPRERCITKKYQDTRHKMNLLKNKINDSTADERALLLKEYKGTREVMLKLPYKSQTDKKIKYIRYCDDFIIAVNGSREDCINIKNKLGEFISGNLKMELSVDKTLITHSNNYARFLGYDVRVRRDNIIKRNNGVTQRTLNNKVALNVPLKDKIQKFLFAKKIIIQKENGELIPVTRKSLLRCTDLEIVSAYNAELRGICNYYSLASNFYMLNYFAYFMEYSCLKTIANKHKSTVAKTKEKFRNGSGYWGIPYKTKSSNKICNFAKYSECKKESTVHLDIIPNFAFNYAHTRTTFDSRLKARECELCGTTTAKYYEIHHVNKVKNLKGKCEREVIMIAKCRKTMVVCKECHYKIHNRTVITN